MVDWSEVIPGCLASLVSHIPFVDFDGQFLDVLDIEVGDGLLPFALSKLSQASDSNEKGRLADSLLMLVGEEFEEVVNSYRPVKGFFKSHLQIFQNLN